MFFLFVCLSLSLTMCLFLSSSVSSAVSFTHTHTHTHTHSRRNQDQNKGRETGYETHMGPSRREWELLWLPQRKKQQKGEEEGGKSPLSRQYLGRHLRTSERVTLNAAPHPVLFYKWETFPGVSPCPSHGVPTWLLGKFHNPTFMKHMDWGLRQIGVLWGWK